MDSVTFTLHSRTYTISREGVLRVAREAWPERVRDYYVEIDRRRFPPTQLVRLAARTHDAPHSHNSRSILTRLGFAVQHPRGSR